MGGQPNFQIVIVKDNTKWDLMQDARNFEKYPAFTTDYNLVAIAKLNVRNSSMT